MLILQSLYKGLKRSLKEDTISLCIVAVETNITDRQTDRHIEPLTTVCFFKWKFVKTDKFCGEFSVARDLDFLNVVDSRKELHEIIIKQFASCS